jgi:hypothetical protein
VACQPKKLLIAALLRVIGLTHHLYVGPETPDFSNQVHGFDPGLDHGRFWTVPVDARDLFVNPGSGRASLAAFSTE